MTGVLADEPSGRDMAMDPKAAPTPEALSDQVPEAAEETGGGELAEMVPLLESVAPPAGPTLEKEPIEEAAATPGPVEGAAAEQAPIEEAGETPPREEPVAVEADVQRQADAVQAASNRSPDPSPEDNLRVAHVLLRMGSPLPARAHLEALAGTNRLDRQGLLDLAESRWRTGDLPGAGEATVAYFEHGGGAALAYLIAAEATAATGRPSEAARFARRALEGLTLPLDAVFSGQPRSPIWPTDPADPGQQAGTLFADTARDPTRGGRIGLTGGPRAPAEVSMGGRQAPVGGVGVMAEPRAGDESDPSREGRPDRSLWDEPEPAGESAPVTKSLDHASGEARASSEVADHDRPDEVPPVETSPDRAPVDRDGLDPALPDVGVELDEARGDLAAGDDRAAAVRLAVVLRLRPALAPAVLEVIGDLPGPDFDLLRGDALRLVGHEAAAQRAFASAASALAEPSEPRRDE